MSERCANAVSAGITTTDYDHVFVFSADVIPVF